MRVQRLEKVDHVIPDNLAHAKVGGFRSKHDRLENEQETACTLFTKVGKLRNHLNY